MALVAGDIHVSPRQGEFCRRIVVECGTLPIDRAVTEGAILREPCGRVVGIRRLLIVREVTGAAGSAQGRVLAAGVAGRTLLAGMSPRQREPCLAVIESCPLPVGCGMAQ